MTSTYQPDRLMPSVADNRNIRHLVSSDVSIMTTMANTCSKPPAVPTDRRASGVTTVGDTSLQVL